MGDPALTLRSTLREALSICRGHRKNRCITSRCTTTMEDGTLIPMRVFGNTDEQITIPIMELRHLRYFTAVAEHGGIGRTAHIVHVAQSAISEQIRDLESELGVALFDRKNRRIRLTYHGEQFFKDARGGL